MVGARLCPKGIRTLVTTQPTINTMTNTNLASRIVAGVQSASPELLADLSLCITLAAEAHPSEAAAYWLSIAAEMRSTSYERRTGA
jgi:hypothetical protein